ncbi:hypothetical protein [Marilutibacter maris]|uniref:hypothetical protein n=1 Tax=Marilutibacter maris TaxID=1605891 RepID=UPI0021D53301|nr:hypothetical protein [Lysobacter maris]
MRFVFVRSALLKANGMKRLGTSNWSTGVRGIVSGCSKHVLAAGKPWIGIDLRWENADVVRI